MFLFLLHFASLSIAGDAFSPRQTIVMHRRAGIPLPTAFDETALDCRWRLPGPLHARPKNEDLDDAAETAEQLPLSNWDIKKLNELRSRRTTMPIMILDSMLPGQCLQFGSSDPKFVKLVDHVLRGNGEIGMIGFNPHTGRPLNMGVTLTVAADSVRSDETGMISISVQGKKRFEVQGEPWMDESSSFYLADVEIVDDREENMTTEEKRNAQELFNKVPNLVEDWLSWVIRSGKSDSVGMKQRLQDIGPMPNEVGERAIWVAALINPIPALGVCLEVRPAMLACRNDSDRMTLAATAIQSSIDHLSGKSRLF